MKEKPKQNVPILNVHETAIRDIVMQDKMGETIPILPLLLPIGAILLIWVIRHKDWLQASLLGENGLKDKLLLKSWPWHLAKSLSREWHQDKAVLITGCDSGLGYRCAALTSAKLISINFHFMQYKKSTFQDIKIQNFLHTVLPISCCKLPSLLLLFFGIPGPIPKGSN